MPPSGGRYPSGILRLIHNHLDRGNWRAWLARQVELFGAWTFAFTLEIRPQAISRAGGRSG